MIGSVDVHYTNDKAGVALVLFESWSSQIPSATYIETMDVPFKYVPGEFYRRELPCILSVLKHSQEALQVLIVDGYVHLGQRRPGLGQYLFEALGKETAVIGVAKSQFQGSDAMNVYRGKSRIPLYITAAGIDAGLAAAAVRQMHGAHRIPTLIRMADQLSKNAL